MSWRGGAGGGGGVSAGTGLRGAGIFCGGSSRATVGLKDLLEQLAAHWLVTGEGLGQVGELGQPLSVFLCLGSPSLASSTTRGQCWGPQHLGQDGLISSERNQGPGGRRRTWAGCPEACGTGLSPRT